MSASKKRRSSASSAAKRYKAPALDKGLQILAHLAGRKEPSTSADIAAAIGYTKPEIYRMLLVLEARGFIERTKPDGPYIITERLFDLGMNHAPTRNLHAAALPLMEELAAETLQSCHLGVVSGNEVVVVARVESPGPVNFSVKLGYRVPIVDSTSGRVIFAFQPPARQTDWLARLRFAHKPFKAADVLASDAKKIAKRGYALEPSRTCNGVHDIGAPIIDEAGRAIASLTMPVIAHRYLETNVAAIAPKVVAAAQEISRRMRSS